jgi:hypothetical protein
VIRLLLLVLVLGAPEMGSATTEGPGLDLGGDFGVATASARGVSTERMELDLSVEAPGEDVVVAHLIEPGGGQEAIPLVGRGGGVFGITTEVRRVDYVVVFEIVRQPSSQSPPVRITDLGVAPALLGAEEGNEREEDGVSNTTRMWGWAGLGLAATALAVLALWALPDRKGRADRPPPNDPPEVEEEPTPAEA